MKKLLASLLMVSVCQLFAHTITLHQYPDTKSKPVAKITPSSKLVVRHTHWFFVEDRDSGKKGWIQQKDLEKALDGTVTIRQSINIRKKPSIDEKIAFERQFDQRMELMQKTMNELYQSMKAHHPNWFGDDDFLSDE